METTTKRGTNEHLAQMLAGRRTWWTKTGTGGRPVCDSQDKWAENIERQYVTNKLLLITSKNRDNKLFLWNQVGSGSGLSSPRNKNLLHTKTPEWRSFIFTVINETKSACRKESPQPPVFQHFSSPSWEAHADIQVKQRQALHLKPWTGRTGDCLCFLELQNSNSANIKDGYNRWVLVLFEKINRNKHF